MICVGSVSGSAKMILICVGDISGKYGLKEKKFELTVGFPKKIRLKEEKSLN